MTEGSTNAGSWAITATVLATLVASVSAQRQFGELHGRGLPVDIDKTEAVALGDVDGDGDLDIVFANAELLQNRLYLNDGIGTFTDVTAARMPADRDWTAAVALGDIDRDGDLDIVFGNHHRQNRLFLNDGSGNYTDGTEGRLPEDSDRTSAVVLGDVDGDGDLDIVFGGSPQNRLYLNLGNGIYGDYTAGRMPVDTAISDTVRALGDVDGDGDLDMAVTNGGLFRPSWLYLNNGRGSFGKREIPNESGASPGERVAMGDVDGDGDLDMVIGGVRRQNRLYLNDGSGGYTEATASRMPADKDATYAVALGDVDGDEDLDIVFGNSERDRTRLYLNDGSSTFTDATTTHMPFIGEAIWAAALGDVDGDGDLDMVLGNKGLQNRICLNLHSQVDMPLVVTPGNEYRLEAFARSGPPRPGDLALAFVSTARATVPLPPYGTIGIDLSRAASFPPFFIPQPSGMSSVSFTMPNQPLLVGVPVYAQALLVPFGGPMRLTNVTVDQIVPIAFFVTGVPASMDRGSKFEVSVAVTNGAADAASLTVEATSTGTGQIRLRRPEASSQTISIDPGSTETVTWRIRARTRGEVKITFTLIGGTGATVQTITRNLTIL